MSSDYPANIYLLHENGQEKIWDRRSCELSFLSKDIIHNIFENDINVLFTQNHLNITPLIGALYTKIKKSDVLIGLPGPILASFKPLYKKYKKFFFSLLYSGGSLFFYENALWCNGRVSEEEYIKNLEVEKKPYFGNRNFKQNYEKFVSKNMKNGNFQNKPKIVSIPINGYLPFQNFEDVNLKFKNKNYTLNKFRPKLIILESINERQFSFESLKNLINHLKNSDKKLILHFSWPYLPKLSNFLDYINENYPNSTTLHMGKILGKKIGDKIEINKPKKTVLPLSLEGELWENIYSYKEDELNDKINYILPNLDFDNVDSAKNYDFIIDDETIRIKNLIKNNDHDIQNTETNLLKYPPFLDTFLSPEKMTRFVINQDKPRYLPLSKSIECKINNEELIKHFKSIEKDLNPFDLVKYFKGLKTPRKIRKKTLLQMYLINEAFDIDKNLKAEYIYLANLHPSLGSQNEMKNDLKTFLLCIKKEVEKLQNIFDKNKDNVINLINNLSENNFYNIERNLNGNKVRIKVKLSLPITYTRGEYNANKLINKKIDPIVAYFDIVNNKVNTFQLIKSINVEEKGGTVKLTVDKISENSFSRKQKTENCYNIEYKDLSNFRYLHNEYIRNSILLVPGPIPYHTIKEEKILISQGYDSLILPFKKIVFFAYPGYNFLRIVNQLKSFEELLTNKKSDLYKKDLAYSLKHTNIKSKRKIFSKIKKFDTLEKRKDDTHLDDVVRNDILEKDEVEEDKESLKEMFKDISSFDEKYNKSTSSSKTTISDRYSDQIRFKVEFYDGSTNYIDFPENSLIRKFESGKYKLNDVKDIKPSDKILYVSNRKTLDNELLEQFFSHVNYDLESILEPLTNLRIFYEVLKKTNYSGEFEWKELKAVSLGNQGDKSKEKTIEIKDLHGLKWLTKSEKENLYNLFKHGFKNNSEEFKQHYNSENNIWKDYLDEEELWSIMSKKSRFSQSLLASIAKKLGLKLAKSTFKMYCSKNIKDQKHYYFEDPINIKVIGKLIGNEQIIKNYETINRHGKEISKVLIKIGRSISRVVSGNKRMGNEMDLYVSKYLKKCTVKEVEK